MVKTKTGFRDIAQMLSISQGTVSRAPQRNGQHAEKTRNDVAEVAAGLDYGPRPRVSRRGATVQRLAVCVGNPCLAPDGMRDTSYVGFHYLIELEKAAAAVRAGVMVGFVDAMEPNAPLERLHVLQHGEAQGVVLLYPFPEAFVRSLAARVPVVSIEHVYADAALDTVAPAHAMDAMAAVEYLHGLGHRRIAFVGDEGARGNRLTIGLRHAGFVSGLTRCGLPYRADDVASVHLPMVEKSDLAKWAATRVRDGVTAIVTAIDRHGYLLWEQLPELGIAVPGDVSLVGIGGVYRSRGLRQLTTWRSRYDAIAMAALDALRARRTATPTTNLYREIASTFVAGESAATSPR